MSDPGAVDVARELRQHGRATFVHGAAVIEVRADEVPVELSTVLRYRCGTCDAVLAATVLDHSIERAAEITRWIRAHRHAGDDDALSA